MIIENNSWAFSEDPIKKLNFEKFSNDKKTKNIIFHIDSMKNYSNFKKIDGFSKIDF
jgi:hypothetical protein